VIVFVCQDALVGCLHVVALFLRDAWFLDGKGSNRMIDAKTVSGMGLGRTLGALAFVAALAAGGCNNLADDAESQQGETTTTPVSSDDILGFEKTPGWTWTSTGQRLSERRTKGIQSFALDAPGYETHLTSQKVSSTAAGLANLGDADSQFALDIMLPEVFKTPSATSFVQLKVKSAARGLAQTDLGKIKLNDLPGGVFKTVKWNIPSSVRSKLANASYTDLIFDIYIHPFDCPSDTIRIDNLRVKAPSRAPAGAGVSVDLVALRTYNPEVSTPGEAHFPSGPIQIPQSFHVKLGKSGVAANTVKLELGYNTTIAYTCTYAAGNVGGTGRSYEFSKCTGGGKVGDIVSADFARLTIVKGDATAGTTKIRAQLAGAPVGDETGRGVIAAIPTFWGDTPDEANGIMNAYSTTLNAAVKTERRVITFPTPELANRRGDGSPRDLLDPNLPPPPNDPPFKKDGHMSPGGWFDAWWALEGKLVFGGADNHQTSHFDATASINVYLWGFTMTMASMQTIVETDSGRVTAGGIQQPNTHGELHMYLFGLELPGGGAADVQTGFIYNIARKDTYNAPPIPIWFFSIQMGVITQAGVTATGALSADGFRIKVAPNFGVAVHVSGGIDLYLASGKVDVTVDLIKAELPITSNLTWSINTSPADCAAHLDFQLDASVALSSGGGAIDLVATLGPCPACYEARWNIFNWRDMPLVTSPIFSYRPLANELMVKLPDPSACHQDLRALVISPESTDTLWAGQTVRVLGMAGRPIGPSTGGHVPPDQPDLDLDLEEPVACEHFTWSSSNPADQWYSTKGCDPLVVWGSTGQRTLTLTVVDEFGEAGSATRVVNVGTAPTGPWPIILSPDPHETFGVAKKATLIGNCVNTAGLGTTITWSQIRNGNETLIAGNADIVPDYTVLRDETVLKLTCTDASGSNSVTMPIFGGTRIH
jgi:hypothetical protein